jgi:hypothetical protein
MLIIGSQSGISEMSYNSFIYRRRNGQIIEMGSVRVFFTEGLDGLGTGFIKGWVIIAAGTVYTMFEEITETIRDRCISPSE